MQNAPHQSSVTPNQRGNALFLILIAVALYAALSYALTQSGRGGGTVDRETAMISAGQITQFPSGIRTAVTRMIITGTSATAVDFTGTTTSAHVFAAAGGGAVYQTPPSGIGNAQCDYAVPGTYASACWGFKDLQQDATKGFLVYNVGTDTATTGRDAIAYLHDISLTVCEQIQKGLTGSTTIPTQNTTALDWTTGVGLGTAAAADGTGDAHELAGTGITGVAFACILNRTTLYDYYHVLIEQ